MYSNTDTEGTIESVRIGTKPPGELLGILGGSVPGLPFEIHFLKDIKEGYSCLRLLNPLTH